MLLLNNGIGNLVSRTATNLLKTGGTFLLANLVNQALKEASNDTFKTLTKDIKTVRREYRENRMEA